MVSVVRGIGVIPDQTSERRAAIQRDYASDVPCRRRAGMSLAAPRTRSIGSPHDVRRLSGLWPTSATAFACCAANAHAILEAWSAQPVRLAAGGAWRPITNSWRSPASRMRGRITDIDDIEVRRRSDSRSSERGVTATPFCTLLRFPQARAATDDPKVLLVAPMSGHFATLLRGTIRTLLRDHEVYVTDWRNPRDVPLEEGASGSTTSSSTSIDFCAFIGADSHIVAVCQPTVPALVADRRHGAGARPRSSPRA